MSRIPLATDLKTRTGAPSTKDARQVNSYMEVKGEQAAVRKRPAAQGGLAIGTGTAQGGIGLTIGGTPYFIGFWGDTLYSYSGSGTSWSGSTSYVAGDHVAVNFVDYWALSDNTNSQPPSGNWSRTFQPRVVYPSPAHLGNVSTYFTSIGTLYVENAAGTIGQLSFTGYSNFGNPIQFNGYQTFSTLFVAFTATRNSDSANVLLIMDGTTYSDIAGGYSTIPSNVTLGTVIVVVLNSTNFPLIGSNFTVASDIGGFAFFSSATPALVVYGTHPSDGTTRYYIVSKTGAITYVTDSTTITNTWLPASTSRLNQIYGTTYINYVNRSSSLSTFNTVNPLTSAAITSTANIGYDPVYGWLAIDKFGNPGGKITAVTGTDWVVYQNGNFAYFIGLSGAVYVVDISTFNVAAGLTTILPATLAISSGGTYNDSYITDTLQVFTSYTTAGDNYINSNGTITTATGMPKLTTGDLTRRRYSVKGQT